MSAVASIRDMIADGVCRRRDGDTEDPHFVEPPAYVAAFRANLRQGIGRR